MNYCGVGYDVVPCRAERSVVTNEIEARANYVNGFIYRVPSFPQIKNNSPTDFQFYKISSIYYVRLIWINKTSENNNDKACGTLDVRAGDCHYRKLPGNRALYLKRKLSRNS